MFRWSVNDGTILHESAATHRSYSGAVLRRRYGRLSHCPKTRFRFNGHLAPAVLQPRDSRPGGESALMSEASG
jgi:hypothetical protein